MFRKIWFGISLIGLLGTLIILASAFWGCGTPQDLSCQNTVAKLSLINPPSSGTVGNITFSVSFTICNEYAGQTMWLEILSPSGRYDDVDYSIPDPTSSTGTQTFTYYFSEVGKHIVWAAAKKLNGHGPPNGDVQSAHSSIEITSSTGSEFKVIQVEMINDNLWPDNTANNYVGATKRDNAFSDASTTIHVIKNFVNVSNSVDVSGQPLDLSTDAKMFTWAISEAYGKSMMGVDPKATVLCGIDDVPTTYVPNPPGSVTCGITLPADPAHSVPPVSVVFHSRITSNFPINYDQVRIKTGSAIHELGHATGISGDDPNINPPHSGTNLSDCTMHSPRTAVNDTYPKFCGGHVQFISTQTWFK